MGSRLRGIVRRVMALSHRLLLATLLVIAAARAPAAEPAAAGGASAAVEQMQQRMLADPQLNDAVQALRDDPNVQDILSDPAIAAALGRGDLGALMTNPKIKRLADDPAVRDITRQMGQEPGPSGADR